jgi:hypothetical protein
MLTSSLNQPTPFLPAHNALHPRAQPTEPPMVMGTVGVRTGHFFRLQTRAFATIYLVVVDRLRVIQAEGRILSVRV